jgi:ankyrin repeat protein
MNINLSPLGLLTFNNHREMYGDHINDVDNDGNSLIMNMQSYKDIELLVKNGADLNIQNIHGVTLLISMMTPSVRREPTDEILRRVKFIEFLMNHGADKSINTATVGGKTALHLACMYSLTRYIEVLLKFGASATILDLRGHNALGNFKEHANHRSEADKNEIFAMIESSVIMAAAMSAPLTNIVVHQHKPNEGKRRI